MLYAVSTLPVDRLKQNVLADYATGHFAKNYPRNHSKILAYHLDMYTECVGIGMALNMHPNAESLLNMRIYGECENLSAAAAQNFPAASGSYMRYLHGYQIFLKPLYTLFSRTGVEIITCAASIAILALFFVILRKNLNTPFAATIILAFLITKNFNVFVTVTHAAQFWVVLAASITTVLLRKRASPLVMFGVIGATDTFFCFMNMASLSLALPMLCYSAVLLKDGEAPIKIIAVMFWGAVGWSVGFLSLWLLKWTILAIVLHPSREQLFGRTLEVYPARSVRMIWDALYETFRHTKYNIWLTACAVLLARKIWLQPRTPGLGVVLFPALIPIIWTIVLPGQTGHHAAFTNIILWPLAAAVFVFLLSPPLNESGTKVDLYAEAGRLFNALHIARLFRKNT